MNCGRIRKPLAAGWTPLVEGELQTLGVGTILLEPGESYAFDTGPREYALVLIRGDCDVTLDSGMSARFGPRRDPFRDMPFGLFVSRDEHVTLTAREPSLIGAGRAPASLGACPTRSSRPSWPRRRCAEWAIGSARCGWCAGRTIPRATN